MATYITGLPYIRKLEHSNTTSAVAAILLIGMQCLGFLLLDISMLIHLRSHLRLAIKALLFLIQKSDMYLLTYPDHDWKLHGNIVWFPYVRRPPDQFY
jgi:hypothetical protein